ncbi:PepSY domain-containing protein [Streptococcus catagoni]|uniref:PepSY domain-containing protein n=1 Tax=Streptococcus catagoni TaxID=2654874 RepID=UPI00140A3C84|nr:PepSY domain-containing protein [Streptococcus catagoni]
MKIKKLSLMLVTSLSVFALAACQSNGHNSDKTDKADKMSQSSEKVMTEARAKEIAFKDAKVEDAKVKNLTVKKENEDGKTVFDIEFDHKDMEYNYSIDAHSGKILEKSKESLADK